jgi:hypothetical protein
VATGPTEVILDDELNHDAEIELAIAAAKLLAPDALGLMNLAMGEVRLGVDAEEAAGADRWGLTSWSISLDILQRLHLV